MAGSRSLGNILHRDGPILLTRVTLVRYVHLTVQLGREVSRLCDMLISSHTGNGDIYTDLAVHPIVDTIRLGTEIGMRVRTWLVSI